MDQIKMTSCWSKKQARLEEAGSELQIIIPSEPHEQPRQQPKGRPSKLRQWFANIFPRKNEPETAIHLQKAPEDVQQLVQKGRFLEACQSISTLAQQGQDCGPQYQVVAENMWQLVREALGGISYSQELELKLQAVVAAVEWAQDKPQSWEAGALQDGGFAAWGGYLQSLLWRDAEARVSPVEQSVSVGPYLEELDKAMGQALGSQRAGRLGVPLWESYRTCFQEVLLSRLSQLRSSCSHKRKSCCELYTWGNRTLFGQLGRETLQKAGPTSWKPMDGNLLDPAMFVTWMFQMQGNLVGLIQKELEEHLEKVLICDGKKWAESPPATFLEILQLLEETINAVRHIGPPVARLVEAMVLGTFSKFLERYKDEASRFIQQNTRDQTFPELHVLENCCILRYTWQLLGQAHVLPVDLQDPDVQMCKVQGAIKFIEDHGRDHLLCRLGHLCQTLLMGHFGKKDKDLVQALSSLWQGLRRCTNMRPTPTYESFVRSLHEVVFGEYIQALATHLRISAPGMSGHLCAQVEKDICKLNDIFIEHGGPHLDDLQEHILQLSESKGGETVDQWLVSLSDRFPGYLRPGLTGAETRSPQVHGSSPPIPSRQDSSMDLEKECCSCCCGLLQLLLRACWHPRCPERRWRTMGGLFSIFPP